MASWTLSGFNTALNMVQPVEGVVSSTLATVEQFIVSRIADAFLSPVSYCCGLKNDYKRWRPFPIS